MPVFLPPCMQFVVGFGSYLWPTTPLEQRQALGPYHRFWGLAVWCAGMAAAAVSCLAHTVGLCTPSSGEQQCPAHIEHPPCTLL